MRIDDSTIVVTGGAGLIGSTTVDQLLRLHAPRRIVIFDDYRWDPHKPVHERPEPAVDLLLELLGDGRYELLLNEYQLAIRKPA